MTAQQHENLIYEGEHTSMACCPALPFGHPRLIEVVPESRYEGVIHGQSVILLDPESELMNSTSCWRGYIGSWEIKDGRLFLTGVCGRFKLIGKGPIFADWVSCIITIPSGEVISYAHIGFESVYEKEINLTIESGLVTHTEEVGNRKDKSHPRDWV